MTAQQKIVALSHAIECVETMHGSVTDKDHVAEARKCTCQHTQTLKVLIQMRIGAYAEKARASRRLDVSDLKTATEDVEHWIYCACGKPKSFTQSMCMSCVGRPEAKK